MKFSIPETISPSEISTLVQRVKTLTGAEVRRTQIVMLETQDEKAAQILKILLGETAHQPSEKPAKLSNAKFRDYPENLSSASWEVVGADKKATEILTIEEKNYRLSNGRFPEGQLLRYKNGKYFQVRGKPGSPQKLIDNNKVEGS